MSVTEAVSADLIAMGGRLPGIDGSALAAAARVLAEQLDDPDNSATSKSMCARELREHMDRLRDLVPDEQEKDALDDLESRRAARRANGGTAA